MKILDKSLEIARAIFPRFGDDGRRCFHITCIWDKNKLLAVGQNSFKTHTKNLRNNVTGFDMGLKKVCSELSAILKVKNKIDNPNWKKLVIVNIRIKRNGKLGNSACCKSCESLIKYFGIKKIFYTFDEE